MNEYYWNLLNAREKKEIAKLAETTIDSKTVHEYLESAKKKLKKFLKNF